MPRLSDLVVLFAFLFYLWRPHPSPPISPPKHQHSDDLEDIRQQFADTLYTEEGGLSLAILEKGKLIVDWHGGYADKANNVVWTNDTYAIAYSATKIFAGLIFAILHSRGKVDYDAKVIDYWPEFGEHGKDKLTVREYLDHKAGLLSFGREFSLTEALDPEVVKKLIEEADPLWTPGTRVGYHALSYGFLIDQLLRRVDGRGTTQFFVEEIQAKSDDKNFHIGLPERFHKNVAKVTNPSLLQSIIAHGRHPLRFYEIITTYFKYGGQADISANYPHFMSVMRMDSIPYNSYDLQSLGSVSNLGIGTASGFAYSVRAAIQQITPEVLAKISKPTNSDFDTIMAIEKYYGHGFFYGLRQGRFTIRFVGNGMQFVEVDLASDRVVVMLRNGLKPGEDGAAEYNALADTVFL